MTLDRTDKIVLLSLLAAFVVSAGYLGYTIKREQMEQTAREDAYCAQPGASETFCYGRKSHE